MSAKVQEIPPSEREPVAAAANVQSELLAAETNALLRELIGEVQQLKSWVYDVEKAVREVESAVVHNR